jgi:hypothetical protein
MQVIISVMFVFNFTDLHRRRSDKLIFTLDILNIICLFLINEIPEQFQIMTKELVHTALRFPPSPIRTTWPLPKRLDSLHGTLVTFKRINNTEPYKTELRIYWKLPEASCMKTVGTYRAMLQSERALIHEQIECEKVYMSIKIVTWT